MKLRVKQMVEEEKLIDVNLPYYYEQNLSGDSHTANIYGKVELGGVITIKESHHDFYPTAIIEIERSAQGPAKSACYMTDRYKSTKAAFDKALRNLTTEIKVIQKEQDNPKEDK